MSNGSFKITWMERKHRHPIIDLFALRSDHFAEEVARSVQESMYDRRGYRIHVALEGDRVVGCVVWRETPLVAEICWMVVATHRERRGIGRALVDCIIKRSVGKRFVQLKTADLGLEKDARWSCYRDANVFWQRCGFRQVATLPKYWPPGDDAALFMRRIG